MLQALINSAQPLINSVKCRCIQVPFGALYGRGNVHGFVCFVCVLFVLPALPQMPGLIMNSPRLSSDRGWCVLVAK